MQCMTEFQLSMEIAHESWRVPPSAIALSAKDIHLWRVDLDSLGTLGGSTENSLSADEIARARRFHFDRDGARFADTRIALRNILARYVPFSPEDISFLYERNGKPELAHSQNETGLRFNVSHSGGVAVVAVSLGRRVGVDVEQYRRVEFLEIASRYFSEQEYRDLIALQTEELQKNFFACWTRKEAFLKAMGEGIGTLLRQVSVTVAHSVAPELLEFLSDPEELNRWTLGDIAVTHDYAAAMAFERGPAEVQHWIFS